uniref:SH3_10 domain-containing protein n=1 Tax=Heterorhabditis bacteriophora TaxID=37862 RepID=A0A1I7XHS4_HETBA
MEEASDAENWMEEQAQRLENNYNRTDFSLEEGERYLRELDEIKVNTLTLFVVEILNKYHSVLMALTERCATISPLWQRGERITRPITVTALCDYTDKNLHIKPGCLVCKVNEIMKFNNAIIMYKLNINLWSNIFFHNLKNSSHPDVDRIEDEVQQLNVRWENVGAQVADRLKAAERALQTQMDI